jgi:hypothetical protein
VTYNQLCQILYKEDAPVSAIDLGKAIPDVTLKFYKYPNTKPTRDGNYLVFHAIYGWCIYGFVTKHCWGYDDEYLDEKKEIKHKIQLWGELDFLEDYENITRNI